MNAVAKAIKEARVARGWTKAKLARALNISASAVSQWESGETFPSLANLIEASVHLDFDIDGDEIRDLLTERGLMLPRGVYAVGGKHVVGESEYRTVLAADGPDLVKIKGPPDFDTIQGLARDVPVMGNAVAGEDADFWLNGTETDRAVRPPGLANARGIFALYTVNDSMYPAWREGALFYVNPNRAPAIGDDVVVEVVSGPEGEPKPAFLKRLKARRAGKIIVEQFNPPRDIEFDRDGVKLYRVIPWEEALGLS